ncbi:MAG: DNA mismatch repair protein MutS [Betaproteobacteria bacterium]|nr:DNA mismatch repair protein MutS [Betaproteobacteria bacterium]NBS94044.1 DNA mismatch repair protein MutS [Betaproteobacteria bacterium]NBT06450.1 DNA mismatch repair protein MutS [Betaproteobacteria bacterium]NBU12482.1 DNA mismatch repair protein MutS [Betaproteobacteria bacterium]NBY53070.1 DNA mismatch repair protein MutS [Betaproteobacteria bacterium]
MSKRPADSPLAAALAGVQRTLESQARDRAAAERRAAAAAQAAAAQRDVFRKAVTDVTPLPPSDRVEPPRPTVPAWPAQRLADEQQVLADSLSDYEPEDLETGEELLFARPGVTAAALRKLKRGHWVIQAQLDLHGLTREVARLELAGFLARCRQAGFRCVRIIHGKGLRSPNKEPVLKGKVRSWLMQRDEVLAFCQAPNVEGGGGAALVLLKSLTD